MQSLVSDGRLHYRDSKLTAQNYQQAKETLHSFFAATKLGYWVKKPVQVEDFFIGIQVFKSWSYFNSMVIWPAVYNNWEDTNHCIND